MDILMTALFILQMAYHIEGNAVHEKAGILLFALFLYHNLLNRKWYAALLKGKYSFPRIFMTLINVSFLIVMLGAGISGVMISREVFPFIDLGFSFGWRKLHIGATAWGYVLMAMHLGLHWGMIMRCVEKKIPKSRERSFYCRIKAGIGSVIVLYSCFAFWKRKLPGRMFGMIEFAFFDYAEPAFFFFADYLCIMALFAAISYYILKVPRRAGK